MRDLNVKPSRIIIEYQHKNWDFEVPMNMDFCIPPFDMFSEPIDDEKCKILVGLNGTGKTTLLKVIEDFYSTFGEISGTYSAKLSAMTYRWKTKKVQFFRSTMHFNFGTLNSEEHPIRVGHSDNFIREKMRMEYYFNELQSDGNELELNFSQYLDKLDDSEFEEGIIEWGHDRIWLDYPIDLVDLELQLISEIDIKSDTTVSYIEGYFSGIPLWNPDEAYDRKVKIYRKFPGTPFGPRDFHKEMIEILTEIGNDNGLKFTLKPDFLFKAPSIKPIYLSALEISEKAYIDDEKKTLMECIKNLCAIEELMAEKSKEEVWDIFGVELNNEQLRTYSEWKYADCGSEEYFEVKTREVIIEDGAGKTETFDDKETMSIFVQPTVYNHPGPFADPNPPSVHGPKEVHQCTLLKGRARRVHRWQDAVIHCEASGIIYSTSDSALEEYLKRDVWVEMGLQNKIKLLSEMFGDVEREEVTALFALKKLSPNFSKYLTSGQSRVYSMIEKAAKSNCDFLLIDEPEVSLHIDWQRKIIDVIQTHTDASYILAATHSPDIIYHHLTKVVELNSAIDD
jgi:ABC-type cobalamin/Fe3+-siderophores transport system ATPase subunit